MIPNALIASGSWNAPRGEVAAYERWERTRVRAPEPEEHAPLRVRALALWARARRLAHRGASQTPRT